MNSTVTPRSNPPGLSAPYHLTRPTLRSNLFPELNTPINESCPFDHKEENGIISLENVKVRKVLSKIELFIEISVFKQDRKLKWLQCVPKYMTAIEIVRQKHEFSDQDIGNFQKNIDEWFQDWIYLTGAGGMTNYIHMLGSGHISEYMYKWRNLGCMNTLNKVGRLLMPC